MLTLSLVVGSMASIASATTYTVTTTSDSGGGSLREAITAANGNAGPDDIVFQAGLNGVIALGSDLPVISEELTISGPGPRNMTISGGNARRVLNASATLTLSGLRLANGFTDRGAGVAFNSAAGLLTVTDCHFDQNTVTNEGGAIVIIAGSLSVERVTFTTDQAAGAGGCIWYGQGGGTPTARIVNCTFVNNFASSFGGAIRQFDATAYVSEVTNCTFVVNNAGNGGGAIAVNGGTMTLRNCLFTANAAGGNPGGHLIDQVGGTITSLGHNLFGNMNGSNVNPDATDKFGVIGNELNTGVLIAFPFNNGGLTDTTPLLGNSIAIDGGTATGAPATDQRGFPRVGCSPDVGAFESQTLPDSDGDGVLNCLDMCPNTPSCATVNEQGCPADTDADGINDGCDLCPDTSAGDPIDANGCSTADEDNDGVLNDQDFCRGTPACAVASVDAGGCPQDADGDGLFDGCDLCPGSNDLTDTDADGIPDCLDPCPAVGDTDADGVQDCEDGCPADPMKLDPGICGCGVAEVDADNDGVIDCVDMCLGTPACAAVDETGCSIDSDNDGVADGCDNCPGTLAGDPVDANGCSTADEDNDGILNDADACRGTPACAAANVGADGCAPDADGDGLFDGCDNCAGADDLADFDGDGIPGCLDACPGDGDTDGDGVQDCQDGCPADPLKIAPGSCGCGVADTDSDGDGIPNCLDACPNNKDTDGDGVQDCHDACPNDAAKLSPGSCGCGNADTDTDGDGIADCIDACPNDGDADGDGVQDCLDECPNDAAKLSPGSCGCGVLETDANNDGIPDCVEPTGPAPAPNPSNTGVQPFIALGPVFPGGVVCGVGLAGPAMLMAAYLFISGTLRRQKRRRSRR